MPTPEPEWHEQRRTQGQALRVLRSLDCVTLLMPSETQADGERMALLTSGSRMGWERFEGLWSALPSIQKRTIYLL